ncbi:heavy-metal-associated domain-containing protein [Altererythrobacter aquaemixtae]|uniref:Heavy-metal-associated domain-containing protein n=2 Tax=Pontixanthobacter aquaemixtae TaxID=1958940 RepID=A0A844ZTH6_9SPHN|nr:heavy-metal-associated domain-containing protein [Pontixanthobacter aquaemixtae]
MIASLPPARITFSRAIVRIGLVLAALLLAILAARALFAQVEGERGIAAVVSSSDIDVGGIEVNETGDSIEDARQAGYRKAQREAWAKLGGPSMPDAQLQGMVSAVVIEQERLGANRYVATLGVIFDRARAGRFLGGNTRRTQSAPMMLVPVTISGGSELVYEKRNPWQRAWAEYQAGSSRINYVRPSGAGSDSLLINYGQTGRRSRLWWRNILDQFEAADVLVPIAKLEHQYPGGPVTGTFTARYGPDNTYLDSFKLSVESDTAVPQMLTAAVKRFDTIFEQALADGKLKPDSSLNYGGASAAPALQRLIELGRAAKAREDAAAAAARAGEAGEAPSSEVPTAPTPTPTVAAVVSNFVVQFASPDAGTIDATLAAVRATPGVRGAATSSLAIGGTSVMNVSYNGDIGALAAALRARGFTVNQGANALAIRR